MFNFWQYALMCATNPEDTESGSSGEEESGNSTGPHIGVETHNGETVTKINEHGYPDNTPVDQMEPEQQAAYWKYHARKHEKRSKEREDYDTIKAKLQEYEQSNMTDAEKQIQQAREEAREETAAEFQGRMVEATLKGTLQGRGFEEKDIDNRLSFIDKTAFLTSDGEVDSDKVNAYLDSLGAPGKQQAWPDTGQGNRGGGKGLGGSVQAGKDLYAQRRGK